MWFTEPMLISITSTSPDPGDLSFLLHKHPDRVRSVDLTVGRAHVFYPESTPERCTATLMVEVDPVRLSRSKRGEAQKANLERLRERSLGLKTSMARREFSLGIVALDRFVAREHLFRTHECVFGVLALASEPVDPRL